MNKKLLLLASIGVSACLLMGCGKENQSETNEKEVKQVVEKDAEVDKNISDEESSAVEEKTDNDSSDSKEVNKASDGEFEGFPELDIDSACKEVYGDSPMLENITNITKSYYERISSVFDLYDGSFETLVPPTGFDVTSDNTQKRIRFDVARPTPTGIDLPENDRLKEVVSEIRFFDDSNCYQENNRIRFRVNEKDSFELNDYHKEIIKEYLPTQDLESIENALNELIDYSQNNDDFKQIKISDERNLNCYVSYSYDTNRKYGSYEISYVETKEL